MAENIKDISNTLLKHSDLITKCVALIGSHQEKIKLLSAKCSGISDAQIIVFSFLFRTDPKLASIVTDKITKVLEGLETRDKDCDTFLRSHLKYLLKLLKAPERPYLRFVDRFSEDADDEGDRL